jgi:hypothetical protein
MLRVARAELNCIVSYVAIRCEFIPKPDFSTANCRRTRDSRSNDSSVKNRRNNSETVGERIGGYLLERNLCFIDLNYLPNRYASRKR